MPVISNTLGMHGGRLCVAEASRGDLGCPTYAPSLTTAGDVAVSGTASARTFLHVVQTGLAAPVSQTGTGGGGSGTPGGSDTYVQYNSGGTFAGSSAFAWNNATSTLTVTNIAGTTATLGSIGVGAMAASGNITGSPLVSTSTGGVVSATALNTVNISASGLSLRPNAAACAAAGDVGKVGINPSTGNLARCRL